jgi:hypothetical protein
LNACVHVFCLAIVGRKDFQSSLNARVLFDHPYGMWEPRVERTRDGKGMERVLYSTIVRTAKPAHDPGVKHMAERMAIRIEQIERNLCPSLSRRFLVILTLVICCFTSNPLLKTPSGASSVVKWLTSQDPPIFNLVSILPCKIMG